MKDCQEGKNCLYCEGSPPSDLCCTSDGGCSYTVQSSSGAIEDWVPQWTFLYNAQCLVTHKGSGQYRPECRWVYQYRQCSAADRCEDPSVGNIPCACGGGGGANP